MKKTKVPGTVREVYESDGTASYEWFACAVNCIPDAVDRALTDGVEN